VLLKKWTSGRRQSEKRKPEHDCNGSYLPVKVKQSRYRLGVAQRVKVSRLHDNGTGWL
jgi:hypothetical protein